jgi:hypothetical protein
MKAIGTLSAKNLLTAIAAGFVLSAFSSASAAGVPFGFQAGPAQGTFQHCGCDNRQAVEIYVQNIINDAQQRGLSCEMSMHVPACITSYCSICGDHPDLMASCVRTGMEYFTSSCGQQQGQLAAAYNMPAPGTWF